MKKMFLFLILFFTLSTVLTADWYYIGSSSSGIINVREFPNNQSRVVTTARNNEIIRVIHKQGNWYKVNIEAGDIGYLGYIHNSMLKKVTEFSIYSKEGYTNVRSKPSSSSKVIARLENGEEVFAINKTGDWYYVTLWDSDIYGYVHKSQLQRN